MKKLSPGYKYCVFVLHLYDVLGKTDGVKPQTDRLQLYRKECTNGVMCTTLKAINNAKEKNISQKSMNVRLVLANLGNLDSKQGRYVMKICK